MAGNTQDLLSRWKRHFDDLSSEFSLIKILDRTIVDYIHFVLLDFWGSDFFKIDFIHVVLENELHFVQSLVYNLDRGSFYKALEVAFLVDYARTNNNHQFKRLQSLKFRSESTRDIFCELLIEYSFNEAGLNYEANAIRGNQILEGYCTVSGHKFLVECKNKYSISRKEMRVISSSTARCIVLK